MSERLFEGMKFPHRVINEENVDFHLKVTFFTLES